MGALLSDSAVIAHHQDDAGWGEGAPPARSYFCFAEVARRIAAATAAGEILDTLRHGRRRQDPLHPAKYKYYLPCHELLPEFNHLIAVIVFGTSTDHGKPIVSNNYVVTAWAVFNHGKG